jgi:hypothetical protein
MPQPGTNRSSTVTLTITVPSEIIARLRAEARVGETASDRDVVERALINGDYTQAAPLQHLDPDLVDWMAGEGSALVAKFRRGEMKSSPAEEVFQRLEQQIQLLRQEQ